MNNKLKNILWGIPVGFINGFFGSGGGVVAVLALRKVFKTEPKVAHATALGVILPVSLGALFMYAQKGGCDLKILLMCSLGGIAGGGVGAKILTKLPKKWIKIGFGIVMIISGVRMVIH